MRPIIFLFFLIPSLAFSQDFSSPISKIAHKFGHAHVGLEQCGGSEDLIDGLTYTVEELKYRAFRESDMVVYEQFFNEHYVKGMKAAKTEYAGLENQAARSEFCEGLRAFVREVLATRQQEQELERQR